jgi:hypothetical protein
MSAPNTPAVKAPAAPAKDAYVELAERIFVALAARVYGTLAGSDQRKPDPKALAAFSFKLAEAFEQATAETPRKQAEAEARKKAQVKLDEVDLSGVLELTKKKS